MQIVDVVVVQSLSRVQLFATPWTAACQDSLSFSVSHSLLKFMSTESVMLEKVKVAPSGPTLCDPMDCTLPGSSVHGILQAGILEWVFPFPSPGDLPNLGIEPRSPTLQADSLPSEPPGKPTII